MDDSFPSVKYSEWRGRVESELKGAAFEEKLCSRLSCGIKVEPLYSNSLPKLASGHQPHLLNEENWRLCTTYNSQDSSALNEQLLNDIRGGSEAVWLNIKASSVGTQWDQVFAEVDLDKIPVLLDSGSEFFGVSIHFINWLLNQKRSTDQGSIVLGIDPLGALAGTGTFPESLATSNQKLALLANYCDENFSNSNSNSDTQSHGNVKTVMVSLVPYQESGAHAIQELAFALATGLEYLRVLEASGMDLKDAVEQISFRFAVGRNFFEELGKIRAFRILWSKVLAAMGCSDSKPVLIHVVTSRRLLALRDPHVNILRNTQAALAGVLGGADLVTCTPFDQLASLGIGPRLARNTLTILREECSLGGNQSVRDAAAGSYFIEQVTHDLSHAAWKLFQEIEASGGMAASLLQGKPQALVKRNCDEWEKRVACKEIPLIGVSSHIRDSEKATREKQPTQKISNRTHTKKESSTLATQVYPVTRLGFENALKSAVSGSTANEIEAGFRDPAEKATAAPALTCYRDSKIFEDSTPLNGTGQGGASS